jgi:nucleotide-binding universal stress UspA family protein
VPALREVLVATDFSEAGNRAVPHAFSLLPQGGLVRVVHVAGEASLPPEQEEALKVRLAGLVPRAAQGGGYTVRFEVLRGKDPAAAIVQAAERFHVDALCLGTHGRSGVARAVLGSVAQEVMARSDRPVLVVRPPAG